MSVSAKQEAVEELWRQALSEYRQEGLRERLSKEWPGNRNVNERIAYEYAPTFQPGYVGPRYSPAGQHLVLMGQNPGEGSDPRSIKADREYRAKLEAFAQGDTGFDDLNRLVASQMVRWPVFKGKGIFRESGAARMSLLDNDVRPSIEDVAYVNYFPFKTAANDPPLKDSFLWNESRVRVRLLEQAGVLVAFSVLSARSRSPLRPRDEHRPLRRLPSETHRP
jgi:hypothetical protein